MRGVVQTKKWCTMRYRATGRPKTGQPAEKDLLGVFALQQQRVCMLPDRQNSKVL